MKKLRKMITVTLSLIMLAACVPFAASAKESSKLIAFTFDDGPGAYTEKLLDGLSERGAKVTFFMTGQNAAARPDTVKRAWLEGHQICSHTYDHAQLTAISGARVDEELSRTEEILNEAIGYKLSYSLRPPYGSYNKSVLKRAGVPCYYWSVDTRDWESRNTDSVYYQIMHAARDGSIVLMHDIHKTTVPAALKAIDKLKEQGYEFVTLNELLVRRGIEPTAGNIYFYAYPDENGTGEALSAPEISFTQGLDGQKVSISGDSRADIYYTTDGSEPMPDNSTRYEGSFAAENGAVVKAVCVYDWNGFKSGTAEKEVRFAKALALSVASRHGMLIISGFAGNATVSMLNVDLLIGLAVGIVAVSIGAVVLTAVIKRRRSKTAVG